MPPCLPSDGAPGFYFLLGGTNPEWRTEAAHGGKPIAGHYDAAFKIDPKPSIALAVEAMTDAALHSPMRWNASARHGGSYVRLQNPRQQARKCGKFVRFKRSRKLAVEIAHDRRKCFNLF